MTKINESLTFKTSEGPKFFDASLAPPDFSKLISTSMFTGENESFMPVPSSSEESIKINLKSLCSSSPEVLLKEFNSN